VNQDKPKPVRPVREKDPYPKMIIVCIVISAVLFVIIMAVLLADFINRGDDAVPGFTPDPAGMTAPGFPPIPEPEANSPE